MSIDPDFFARKFDAHTTLCPSNPQKDGGGNYINYFDPREYCTYLPPQTNLKCTQQQQRSKQVLRDQLRERHEEHEKGLKEHLEAKARASKANLERRRNRRRSMSQGPESVRRLYCSPLPALRSQAQHAGSQGGGGGEAEGEMDDRNSVDAAPSAAAVDAVLPDICLYKKMLKVCGQRE